MPSSIRRTLDKCWQVDGSLKPEDFTRGLRRSPFAELPDKPMEEMFIWIVEPPDGLLEGDLYTDSSLKDNEACLEGKCVALGWAFVVFDVDGRISAAAHGCAPAWMTSIYGAELWAVQMVMPRAMPGAVKILSYSFRLPVCAERLREGSQMVNITHSHICKSMGGSQSSIR